MSQGLLFQGHYWFYCSGCSNPTVGQCCGQLQPWQPDTHGNLPNAIRQAHGGGHQFGYRRGYGGHNDYGSFLGTFLMVDGMADGDVGEAMAGAMLGGGGRGGRGGLTGILGAEMFIEGAEDGDVGEELLGLELLEGDW
jgi:hypothetical protein